MNAIQCRIPALETVTESKLNIKNVPLRCVLNSTPNGKKIGKFFYNVPTL